MKRILKKIKRYYKFRTWKKRFIRLTIRGNLIKLKRIFMNDKQAKKIIVDYLKRKRKKGITKISLLDFHWDKIKLPIAQVNRIMTQLEKEGKIKES